MIRYIDNSLKFNKLHYKDTWDASRTYWANTHTPMIWADIHF